MRLRMVLAVALLLAGGLSATKQQPRTLIARDRGAPCGRVEPRYYARIGSSAYVGTPRVVARRSAAPSTAAAAAKSAPTTNAAW